MTFIPKDSTVKYIHMRDQGKIMLKNHEFNTAFSSHVINQ